MPLEPLDLHDAPVVSEPDYEDTYKSSINTLDLSAELAANYQLAKASLEEIRYSENAEVQDKARLLTVLSSILKDIIKLQSDVYSVERSKKLEQVLIHTLKRMPTDVQNHFFEQYEAAGLHAGI